VAQVPDSPWWKGARGEWYVIAQVGLFALVVLGPRTLPGLPAWGPTAALIGSVLGVALMPSGAALSVAGLLRLGPNLTPLPYPKDCSELVDSGAYAIVRHPIYSGLILAAFGWGLWVHGGLTLVWALLLFAFFDVKSRLEERWLAEKFADYRAYQQRVRKLIPWVY
jgi:protein-S-isoprenylcysteine O-methyltransferase Ste14